MAEKDSNLEIMVRGLRSMLLSTENSIEEIARSLDRSGLGLNASQLPEYQKAIDAINAYKEALVEHFTKKYNEPERQITGGE